MYAYVYIAEFAVHGERRRIGDTSWRSERLYTTASIGDGMVRGRLARSARRSWLVGHTHASYSKHTGDPETKPRQVVQAAHSHRGCRVAMATRLRGTLRVQLN